MLEHFSWRIEKGILHHNNNTDQVTKEGKEINKKREREREKRKKGRKRKEEEWRRAGEGAEREKERTSGRRGKEMAKLRADYERGLIYK